MHGINVCMCVCVYVCVCVLLVESWWQKKIKEFGEKSLPVPPVQTDEDCIQVNGKLSLWKPWRYIAECRFTLGGDNLYPLNRSLGGPQRLSWSFGGALLGNGNGNAVSVFTGTYLGGEGVAVDAVFRAPVVLNAIVHVYFLELVLVRQWTTRDVNVVPRGIFHSEHDTVSSVADTAAHLSQKKKRITH